MVKTVNTENTGLIENIKENFEQFLDENTSFENIKEYQRLADRIKLNLNTKNSVIYFNFTRTTKPKINGSMRIGFGKSEYGKNDPKSSSYYSVGILGKYNENFLSLYFGLIEQANKCLSKKKVEIDDFTDNTLKDGIIWIKPENILEIRIKTDEKIIRINPLDLFMVLNKLNSERKSDWTTMRRILVNDENKFLMNPKYLSYDDEGEKVKMGFEAIIILNLESEEKKTISEDDWTDVLTDQDKTRFIEICKEFKILI